MLRRLSETAKSGVARVNAPLAVILSFSLFSKLGLSWWLFPRMTWYGDSSEYHGLALTLLRTGAYLSPVRPPGYPALLALVYSVLGVRPYAVVLIQAFLATVTVSLTYRLGKRVFGESTALVAAAFLALDVASFESSQMLLTETCFTMLLLLGISLLLLALRDHVSPGKLVLAGLCFALATLMRPISYYLLPVLGLWILVRSAAASPPDYRLGKKTARVFAHVCCFFVVPLLLVGGWQVVNYVRFKYPGLSSVQTKNEYYYRAAGVLALVEHRPFSVVNREMGSATNDSVWLAHHPEDQGLAKGELWQKLEREAMRIVLRHPTQAACMTAQGAAKLLLQPAWTDLGSHLGWVLDPDSMERVNVSWRHPIRNLLIKWRGRAGPAFPSFVELLLLMALYIGAFVWVVAARRRDWTAERVLLMVILVYFLLVSGGPEAYSRFRVCIAPILSLFGAAGLVSLLSRRRSAAMVDEYRLKNETHQSSTCNR